MFLRRSSCTSRRMFSTFLGVELVEVRSDLSSSSSDVLPLLKRVCDSKHLARLWPHFYTHVVSFQKSPLQICRVSRRIWCLLSTPVSRPCWNRKCEGTHGDKHSCCATPNVHTATPLGVLSSDLPCSQTQRTRSSTAIGWRSMELVSKLFDTPTYVLLILRHWRLCQWFLRNVASVQHTTRLHTFEARILLYAVSIRRITTLIAILLTPEFRDFI